MSDQSKFGNDDDPQQLPVRVRSVYESGTHTEVRTSVYCPKVERSVPLEACSSCGAGAGFCSDRGMTYALCRFPSDSDSEHGAGTKAKPSCSATLAPRDDVLAEKLAHPVSEVMTKNVICVREEMLVDALRKLLIERGISGTPVVDTKGRPIGMVSKSNLVEYQDGQDIAMLSEEEQRPRCVRSIMTPLSLSVHERSNVAQAAALMAYEGIHRLPVIDDAHEVVGVVSALDVLRWLGQRCGYLVPQTHKTA